MARSLGLALGLAAAGLFLVAMTGCGSDSDDGGTTGGTGGATGGTGGATGGTGGATGGTGGATGGTGGATGGTGGATGGTGGSAGTAGGTSCADAIDYATEADDTTGMVSGVIDPAGDADYIAVELSADQFYILSTDANPDDDVDMIDTVISVYTADGSTLLATADDSVPRVSTDSELIYHSPEAQTVCVKIEDFSTWAGETPAGDPTFTYEFGVFLPDMDADVNNLDTEPNDDIANAQDETFAVSTTSESTFSWVYGTLESNTDVDVFKYTMPANNVASAISFVPAGPGGATHGNGSTTGLGLVEFSDGAGNVLARLDVAKGSSSMNPPIAPGTEVFLWVNRPAGGMLGSNDFYSFVHQNYDGDNDAETETASGGNDVLADADTITQNVSTYDPKVDIGYVLGFIQGAGDVDYFAFNAEAGDAIGIVCGSIRDGSGLIDPVFAIHDTTDTVLQSETETDAADVWWSNSTYGDPSDSPVTVATTGLHYLVVTAGGQDPEVSGNYYRCNVNVTTP